jgi:hypothetical protein
MDITDDCARSRFENEWNAAVLIVAVGAFVLSPEKESRTRVVCVAAGNVLYDTVVHFFRAVIQALHA